MKECGMEIFHNGGNLHSFSVLPNLERKTSLKERFVGILLVELPIYLLYHDGTDYVVKLSLIDIWNLDGKLKYYLCRNVIYW